MKCCKVLCSTWNFVEVAWIGIFSIPKTYSKMSCIVYTICFSMGTKTGTSRLNPFDSFPLLIKTIKVSHTIQTELTSAVLDELVWKHMTICHISVRYYRINAIAYTANNTLHSIAYTAYTLRSHLKLWSSWV